MTLQRLLDQMREEGQLDDLASNPLVQFGTATRAYVGATILPERTVEQNQFTESAIRYRTIIANDGSRYSPVQLKSGVLVGEFDVKLADQDIGSQMTGNDLDTLIRIMGRNLSMQAMASITRFLDRTVVRPLAEKSELQRWQAIVNANVPLRGDHGYRDEVAYSNPAGHRVAAGGDWADDAYDPFDDLIERKTFMAAKGVTLTRIIAGSAVTAKLLGNAMVAKRTGRAIIQGTSVISLSGAPSMAEINGRLAADGIPAIETYDLMYQTNTGSGFFLPRNVVVFIGATDSEETIATTNPDQVELVSNTLGYTAIGRAVGQSAPGRVIKANFYDNKPPRIGSEGWQTSLPVITEPEAIAVLTGV